MLASQPLPPVASLILSSASASLTNASSTRPRSCASCDAARAGVHADDLVRPQRLAQHRRRQAHRPQARDQQPVLPVDLDARQRLPGRAEAAGDQRAVHIGQVVRQGDAGVLLGQQVRGVAAVALPAVGGAVLAVAGDHVAGLAVLADAAAADVVQHDAVAGLELLAARADLDDLPARLMPGDDAPVGLVAHAQVLAVDGADVAAADGDWPSSAPGPARGPASGSGCSRNSTVLLPGSTTPAHGSVSLSSSLIVVSLTNALRSTRQA